MSVKERVTTAFRQLRAEGFFAKQRHTCCQSCGWSEVPEGKTDVVFYHRQDADAFNHQGNLNDRYKLHLAHRGNAARAVEVLREHGLKVEWDGTDSHRIAITGEVTG